ncbi:hypothetical protein H0920_12090 [Acinetobacter sp. C_4_1]|uniref:hypothetical protein n=1 Tax=unclassified Acinetobacter TaxID=196816 RepID=UPI0021B7C97D|nr:MULTISPECIES: hypothetical protein [unclassified Acinetobacter]MCT8090807.1 hypothetical protein [Acinetobacter sp. F_3_1]MCT8099253.1 hypothetical protein [Acinetobacter sp. C_3_1]MCT8101835.1 hypothetical protein [Acinetobacter sp. C_4_1]MCT8135020.1 hypothetical protein [Acinetobacter sp. T_3_1]
MNFCTKLFSLLIHHQANADALLLSEQLDRQDQLALIFADFFQNITLDYSLTSLKKIDYYLSKVRNYFQLHNQQPKSIQEKLAYTDEITRVILRVGAYLGETLRQQNKNWIWVNTKEQICTDTGNLKMHRLILTDHIHKIDPMHVVMDLICAEEQPSSLYQYAKDVLGE